MIGKIQGIIDFIGETFAIIMAGGVGYRVFCPTSTLARLEKGVMATLWVETIVREDFIHLHGFLTEDDHQMFNLLTTVQGVGPKAAMAVLGVMNASAVIRSVQTGDKAMLTTAPGIGGKAAERIVSELRNKIKGFIASAPAELVPVDGIGAASPAFNDAISALEGLGYKRASALPVVKEILDNDPALPLDKVIMQALKLL
jgi:Holliday junction DNA helicase RuvA